MRKFSVFMLAMAAFTTASAQKHYEMGDPADSRYDYLKDYLPLKEYIDHEMYPNFKLGIAVSASDYNSGGTIKSVANNYFTELVTANAMKMSSCVGSDGKMDFTTVKRFVQVASSKGQAIYGHTLAWHSQQAAGWLNSLLKDKHPDDIPPTEVTEERRCLVIHATKKVSDTWDNQFWIIPGEFKAGDTYEFSAEVRATYETSIGTQTNNKPTEYVDWQAIGSVKFTTEWQTFTKSGVLPASGKSIGFNLNDFAEENTYYFDNVSFKINGEERVVNGDFEGDDTSSFAAKYNRGGAKSVNITDGLSYLIMPTVPLTAEEKHDTLVWAMDKWMDGIMTATNGKVKAWDVVNEPLADGTDADGDGFYDLKRDNGSGEFFWQDHMGDLEYVRQAVRLVRKNYAKAMEKHGGDDEELKLFVNDYNLESDWDGNQKLKSLIHWIEQWESDGVTRIDGIGTQMHITYYMNNTIQNYKKSGITNMLKLLASTGKQVRISELDMGIMDASGKYVGTENVTETMHKRMGEFYEWIVKQYLAIIPPEQQWGICQWCATDMPKDSGWRADTPTGIWSLDWYRKHVYAGIARGLGAPKDPTAIEDIEAEDSSNISPLAPPVFDLSGRCLSPSAPLPPGLYIVNGRKVVNAQK